MKRTFLSVFALAVILLVSCAPAATATSVPVATESVVPITIVVPTDTPPSVTASIPTSTSTQVVTCRLQKSLGGSFGVLDVDVLLQTGESFYYVQSYEQYDITTCNENGNYDIGPASFEQVPSDATLHFPFVDCIKTQDGKNLDVYDTVYTGRCVYVEYDVMDIPDCGFGPIAEGALMHEAKHVNGALYQLTGNTKFAKDGEYCESGLPFNIDDVDGSFLGAYGYGFVRGQIEHEPEIIWIVGHSN